MEAIDIIRQIHDLSHQWLEQHEKALADTAEEAAKAENARQRATWKRQAGLITLKTVRNKTHLTEGEIRAAAQFLGVQLCEREGKTYIPSSAEESIRQVAAYRKSGNHTTTLI